MKNWTIEIRDRSFVRTFPEPRMYGGGLHVENKELGIRFLATFMEDERDKVVDVARKVTKFLNKEKMEEK
jgi:hypothetical protein